MILHMVRDHLNELFKNIEDIIAEKIISDNIGEGDKVLLILIIKE